MRTVATEEHFITPEVLAAWEHARDAGAERFDIPEGEVRERLLDTGDRRTAAMDAAGIDVGVISLSPPGLQTLSAARSIALQTDTNDRTAELVAAASQRLQGFATLATPAPAAAAAELERAVTHLGLAGAMVFGRTGERNLDDRENWPIFEAAAALGAPLYIHPQLPQADVRRALYSGFSDEIDTAFARAGIGWHYESGMQFLRMCLAGVFDRFPDLQVILGHWGEVVLFFLERVDDIVPMTGMNRTFSEYAAANAYVTAGGIYSHRYLRWATEVVGVERVLFAADYPYRSAPEGGVGRWLAQSGLEPADQEAIAAGNWERLMAGIRR